MKMSTSGKLLGTRKLMYGSNTSLNFSESAFYLFCVIFWDIMLELLLNVWLQINYLYPVY